MTKEMKKVLGELSSMELNGQLEATKEERSEAGRFLGKMGGKQSAKVRFEGKTKEEISEMMSKVRKGEKKLDKR